MRWVAINVIIEIVACVLIADFCTGVFHWLEDSYGDPDWPIFGLYVTRPNITHHFDPRHFVKNNSWFGRLRAVAILAAVLVLIAIVLKVATWQVLLGIALGASSNEIHKWSHSSAAENGPVISLLQRVGVLQSPRHHVHHHSGGRDTHYCVITNYVNPLLEAVCFWRSMEAIILRFTGIEKRADPSLELMAKNQKFVLADLRGVVGGKNFD